MSDLLRPITLIVEKKKNSKWIQCLYSRKHECKIYLMEETSKE